MASLMDKIIRQLLDTEKALIEISMNTFCTMEKINEAPYYSIIMIDEEFTLHLETFWRVRDKNRVMFSIKDDKQKFGLNEPFDVMRTFSKEFEGVELINIEIKRPVSDMTLIFKNEKRMEIFVDSSGYEGWIMSDNKKQVICLGGGDISVFE